MPSLQLAVASDTLNILIVEDHPVYLEGLCLILEELADKVNIQTVVGVEQAQHILKSNQAFDLILLDLTLKDGSGLSLLRYVQAHRIPVPVAILSASEDQQDITNTIKSGASGFISKAKGKMEILSAVRDVLNGETYLPSNYQNHSEISTPPSLTPRQYEVLQLLAEGLPNKQICRALDLTEHTVKTHIKTLYQVFNVHNRTECAAVASDLGFIK